MNEDGRVESEREEAFSGLASASEGERWDVGDGEGKLEFAAVGARELSMSSPFSPSLPSPRFSY